jgi:NAD(P)-dependent dehydrogenase (short-subunit alcohol dehydrogenase family)
MGSGAPGFGSMAPAYSVSKAALNKAVQLMAAHPAFTAHGVRVVSTCPGWCRCARLCACAWRRRAVQSVKHDAPGACERACARPGECVVPAAPAAAARRTDMGGSDAERSAEKGAESILWPWAHWADGLNATFTRDGEQHPW